MAGLEDTIAQLLGNPESMSTIMSLAQSLSGQAADAESAAAQPPDAPQPSPALQTRPALAGLQQALGLQNVHVEREAAFFHALAPFLQPSRREKIDKILEIARLSHLAGYALQNFSTANKTEGENHV